MSAYPLSVLVQVDEEFRFVQRQLKSTVLELLRVYLKGKQPLKSDAAIAEILQKRTQGLIHEEEWSDIVRYMYAHEDAPYLPHISAYLRTSPRYAQEDAAVLVVRIKARCSEI